MVATRVLRASSCASCRLSLLRSFTSIAVPTPRFVQVSCRVRPSSNPIRHSRLYSNYKINTPNSDGRNENNVLKEEAFEEENQDLDNLEKAAGTRQDLSTVPWYLQVQSPQREPKPLSERQRIPDLPEHPPPILESLLQRISIDIGLDDLTLLDLRKLDPPPALGANLIMLLGTARSERHLHVSADRLCRWLRTTHKLRPDADGLLGRNELKLKLRRKAKRAKLLGGTSDDGGDDGVRTGWVCVDIGVVESAEGDVSVIEKPGFVGFGRQTDGVRIVVQMLTEEKRLEIDLEKLWGGILKRSKQKVLGEPDENVELDAAFNPAAPPKTVTMSLGNSTPNGPLSTVARTREFHTISSKCREVGVSSYAPYRVPQPPQLDLQELDLKDVFKSVITAIDKNDFDSARASLLKYKAHVPQLEYDNWRPFLLEQLLEHVQNIPTQEALKILGSGSSDHNSTPFLQCFYKTLSTYPTTSEMEARIWLHCFAAAINHPGYDMSALMDLHREIQSYGVPISKASYLHLIQGVLRPRADGYYHGPSGKMSQATLEILDSMYARGFDILDEEIFVELLEATSPRLDASLPSHSTYKHPDETFNLTSFPMSLVQERLHTLMMVIDVPCFRDESRIRIMELYAGQQSWKEFVNIWRMAPRLNKPQSPTMYAYLFNKIAETNNQSACMKVLRTYAPEIEREVPFVPMKGDVAKALRACLIVADPFVETKAVGDASAKGEWVGWWKKCLDASSNEGGRKVEKLLLYD
ncbi:hypothetical protein BGZ60DRAFT_401743 [Tricladium varicosporioides]|nr:hypothetical protein BGZ60DRAFT_401743 [Hymenoscyphus varicosporioides]